MCADLHQASLKELFDSLEAKRAELKNRQLLEFIKRQAPNGVDPVDAVPWKVVRWLLIYLVLKFLLTITLCRTAAVPSSAAAPTCPTGPCAVSA